ncbi:MAG TPA: hypothetical protein VLH61_03955 [Bacteroidales bacterium]|nr:hypothetical protein [Bacteroidales bacterium]
MAITFFKTPKNKRYNYKPVFYDPKAEERNQRQKTAIEEGTENYEQALRSRMNLRWKRTAGARDRKASNQRFVIILVVLAVILYVIIFIF